MKVMMAGGSFASVKEEKKCVICVVSTEDMMIQPLSFGPATARRTGLRPGLVAAGLYHSGWVEASGDKIPQKFAALTAFDKHCHCKTANERVC